MGQRCNLFVLSDGRVDIYYDHWAANRLDHELFWGPELALAFVRHGDVRREGARPGEVFGEELLDDVWAEGGALIDLDGRRLLWFGGEDILHELTEHQVHLDLMRRAWSGWRVEWAAEGMTALARAIGVPDGDVITRGIETAERLTEPLVWDDKEIHEPLVATAQTQGGPVWATLSGDCEGLGHHTASPEALLALIEASPLAPFALQSPISGIHLDVPRRFLGCWSIRDQPRLAGWLVERWPGWTTAFWGDDPSEHARLRPDLPWPTVTTVDRLRCLDRLEAVACREPNDPAGSALDVAVALRAAGRRVEINPAALGGRASLGAREGKLALITGLREQLTQEQD